MFINVLVFEIMLKDVFNLKDRKRIIQILIQKLKNTFNVSINDVSQDIFYNKTSIVLCTVSDSKIAIDSALDKIYNFFKRILTIEILNTQKEII